MIIARELGQVFATFFKRRSVNILARKTGFVKRKSELDGFDFLLALTLGRFKKSGQYADDDSFEYWQYVISASA